VIVAIVEPSSRLSPVEHSNAPAFAKAPCPQHAADPTDALERPSFTARTPVSFDASLLRKQREERTEEQRMRMEKRPDRGGTTEDT